MYERIGQALIAGIGTGGMYGLIAMGYTLILACSGVFNFAQGSILMIGTLLLYGLWVVSGIPLLLSFAILCSAGALVGVVTYFLAVRPVTNRSGVRNLTEGTLVTTLGLGLALNTIAGEIFGYDTDPIKSYVSESALRALGLAFSYLYIVMVAVTIVIALLVDAFLRRTRVGIALRATVDDAVGATLLGVRTNRMILTSFALGGALAALAGAMLTPITFVSVATAGGAYVLYGFAAMAIGGFGSFPGALVGGVIIGVLSTVTPVFINPNYTNLVIYAFMVIFLAIRPSGLFGVAGRFGAARLREV